MSYKEILHIGANKSASTTLQRSLFAKTSDIIYLGEDCNNYEQFRPTLNQMIYEDDFNYLKHPVNTLFQRYTDQARTRNLPFLYSNEDIMTSRVPSQVLNRLSVLMPEATVFIIIRNQLEAIPSWYANHGAYLKNVPLNYWRKYVSADEFMNHSIRFFNYSALDCFMYHKVLKEYAKVFGKENIKILFFEDFVSNRTFFVSELSKILEINETKIINLVGQTAERKRVSQRRHNLHKLSRTIPFVHESKIPTILKQSIDKYLDGGPKAKSLGIEKWKSKLFKIYAEDNRALEKEFNIDLSKYDYPR